MEQSAYGMTYKGLGLGSSAWQEFEDKVRSSRPYFRRCTLNDLPVISPPAEIDLVNCNQLTQLILDASIDARVVIVDMTATIYIDAACIGALVRANRRLQDNGVELRVATINARTRWMMTEFGQDRLFRVFDTLPEAVIARPRYWSVQRQAA